MTDFEVTWQIERRIIFARPWGHHTLESATAFGEAISAFLDDGEAPVHLIVDDSGIQSAPHNLNKLFKTMGFVRHPALGWGIMIGNAPRAHRFLIDMVGRLSRINYRRFDTLTEALIFLRVVDRTLAIDDMFEDQSSSK